MSVFELPGDPAQLLRPIRLEETATVSAPMKWAESRIASTSPRSGRQSRSSSATSSLISPGTHAPTTDIPAYDPPQHGGEASDRFGVADGEHGTHGAACGTLAVQVLAGRVSADDAKGQRKRKRKDDESAGEVGASGERDEGDEGREVRNARRSWNSAGPTRTNRPS